MTTMRTAEEGPGARLGQEGTDHFWLQRVTGALNALLSLFVICLGVSLVGADSALVKTHARRIRWWRCRCSSSSPRPRSICGSACR